MSPVTTPRDVIRQLVKGGSLSIIIKVSNGLLAYLMLLIIARASSPEQYGIFAVAFSVSVTIAIIAGLGQSGSITRFWPQWTSHDQMDKARSVLRLSLYLSVAGLSAAAFVMLSGGGLSLALHLPWSFEVAAAVAFFTFAFGFAEYASAALRAQGYVVTALAPRDILWRVLVCLVFGIAGLYSMSFNAYSIILILGAILLITVAPQALMLVRSSAGSSMGHLTESDKKVISRYSVIMWAMTAIQMGRSHVGVVIVSTFLGVEAAGAYFAADRTANILSFILLAVNLVSAPLISRYVHSDRMELVRLIVGLSGLAAGAAALAGLIFFVLFGTEVLSLFDPAYGSYAPVLLILCCGQFFNAATGPVGPLLMLSGHERMDLIIITTVSGAAVALQIVFGFYWGAIGVALANAGASIFGNVFASAYAWRKIRIDTTGLSLAGQVARRIFFQVFRKARPAR